MIGYYVVARYRNSYRYRGYRRYNSRYSKRDIGKERALEHIEEARKLSEELGGTDKIVKQYLFKLRGAKLNNLLRAYERNFGSNKRKYAEETLPDWRSGKRQMSGLVAERLYGLLPPLMPIKTKYSIAEGLWEHFGPSSSKLLRFGSDATADQLESMVSEHITSVVQNYSIPEHMSERFEWLSSGDVEVKQQILNYLRQTDRDSVVQQSRTKIEIMIESFFGEHADQVKSYEETLRIGKHILVLKPDRNFEGSAFETPPTPVLKISKADSKSDDTACWWVIGVIILIIIIANVT